MDTVGSILVADDEDTFCESTCRLLRREGFDCDATNDADEAVANLRRRRYDLLMADIRLPRNNDLRIVREARELNSQMPVILVTGYPSVETAIRSVELSVMAYLTKPLDFDELVSRVRVAIEHSHSRQALSAIQQRLSSCLSDLEAAQTKRFPRTDGIDEVCSVATIRVLASSLSDLLDLGARSGARWGSQNLCGLLDCPQQAHCLGAIDKTIKTLRNTKDVFKSKMLGTLRVELEALLGRDGQNG